MKKIFLLVFISFLFGCARHYHVYNIVNGKVPDKSEVEVSEEKVELKGLVIYQRFEVLAEVPKNITTEANTKAGATWLP